MVFDHLIYLRDKEKLRPSTLNQAVVALRMFYRDYLERDWQLWEQFEIRRDQPLPMVLTRDEVHQLMGAVRENRFKAVLALIYHCGLRVGEAVRLRPKDIDSKRGMLRVIDGKGGRNREVPVAPQMIERLRGYWCFHRNAHWLFPGVGRGWKERSRTLQAAMAAATEPMSVSSVQAALRVVVPAARIKKNATCHTLRHSFATHLLEDGVSIRQVSTYLGHSNLASTLVYLHVTEISESRGREVQAALAPLRAGKLSGLRGGPARALASIRGRRGGADPLAGVGCGRGGVELPYGAPWRSCASLSRLPAASFLYHSCNHRACPRCGAAEQAQWTRRQEARLLPVPYYLLTLTAPAEMRSVFLHFPRGDGSGVLCCHCQCAEGVVRPQEVPRREHRIHSDPAHLDPADALSSPHPCARPGSGARSKRLRTQTSA